jgi:hypothetical protein
MSCAASIGAIGAIEPRRSAALVMRLRVAVFGEPSLAHESEILMARSSERPPAHGRDRAQ